MYSVHVHDCNKASSKSVTNHFGQGVFDLDRSSIPLLSNYLPLVYYMYALVGNDLSYCSLNESCYESQSSVWIRAVKHYFLINNSEGHANNENISDLS